MKFPCFITNGVTMLYEASQGWFLLLHYKCHVFLEEKQAIKIFKLIDIFYGQTSLCFCFVSDEKFTEKKHGTN